MLLKVLKISFLLKQFFLGFNSPQLMINGNGFANNQFNSTDLNQLQNSNFFDFTLNQHQNLNNLNIIEVSNFYTTGLLPIVFKKNYIIKS